MKGNINPEYLYEVRKLIGSWLRIMREEKGMSQEELSEKMGVRAATISSIENGKWAMTIDMLALFAIHLDFYPIFVEKDSKDELAKSMRDRWKRAHDEN